MTTTKDQTVAAGHSVAPAQWQAGLDELLGRVAGRFGRVEPRQHAKAFVLGLLADLPRKNCWTIAEHAGDPSPDGMQHLLSRAVWDEDAVRDDVRAYVVEHLGGPDAVLVIDETGDLKKGTTTVGVQRQYTGTAGRVENVQVAVYLVYATSAGHVLIDRDLYLPRAWTDDPERCQTVGVPDQVGFATKPALAAQMRTRALDAGVPAAWVTGDEVYGADPGLRAELEARGVGYVLAVACDHRVRAGGAIQRADALLRQVPARAWQQVSCGKGAKGHRLYDWAFIRLDHDDSAPGDAPGDQAGEHWLLVRRNHKTGELAFYRCSTPRPVPLATLVHVAGIRWTVEERFQTGKGLVGLDQHQVRRWRSWYRWVTLAMLAHAFLVVGGRDRTQLPAATVGADPADLQRGPASICGPGRPAGRGSRPPAALVGLAAPAPGTRPYLPLPTTSRLATVKITVAGWSTDEARTQIRELIMKTVTVRTATLPSGLTLPYAETGDPGGTPVVFIHAYVESWRYFEVVVRHLPASLHGYAPTQRGHGDADRPPDGYRPEDFAADIVGFMDALGIRRAVLVGSSSGGLVSQFVAGSHPDRVSALVLISSPATLADKPGVTAMWEEISALDDPLDRGFVEEFVRSTSPESVPDEFLEVLVGESLKVPARVWKETMRGLIDADVPVTLDRITAPTLLISGDYDAFVSSDQEMLLRGIPGARLVVYKGVGHAVHLAQPDRVIGDLVDFLAKAVSTTSP